MSLTRTGQRNQFLAKMEELAAEIRLCLVRAELQPRHRETWLLKGKIALCQGQALKAMVDNWDAGMPALEEKMAEFREKHRAMQEGARPKAAQAGG